jgi:hypothetical protein
VGVIDASRDLSLFTELVELDGGQNRLNPPLSIGDPGQDGWSISGAERAQPVASVGESVSPENGSNKPKRLPHLPIVAGMVRRCAAVGQGRTSVQERDERPVLGTDSGDQFSFLWCLVRQHDHAPRSPRHLFDRACRPHEPRVEHDGRRLCPVIFSRRRSVGQLRGPPFERDDPHRKFERASIERLRELRDSYEIVA